MPSTIRPLRAASRNAAILFLALASLIVLGSLVFSSFMRKELREDRYRAISAIGQLKVDQVQQWHRERKNDAHRAALSPFFIRGVRDWLEDEDRAQQQETWKYRLALERNTYRYADTLLVDFDGQILIAANDAPLPMAPQSRAALESSLQTGEATISAFFQDDDGAVYADVIKVVYDGPDNPLLALVLRANATEQLFPIVQTWPTPSASAEAFLVERVGDEVLFLNDLRHRENSAFTLRFPLSQTDLPAVQAALGNRGIFEGVDYRGERVLADLREVPGTPWFLVVKIDLDEIFAEAWYRTFMLAIIGALAMFAALLLSSQGYRRTEASLYHRLYEKERGEREAREAFRTILYSIGDGVITTDDTGHIDHMNPVAEALTGWSEKDAMGQPLEEVFTIIDEETRTAVENPALRVLRDGAVVGLANHTILIAKDGNERPIADSAAPILCTENKLLGVVLVFRDQSEERANEAQLRESEARFRNVFNQQFQFMAILDAEGRLVEINDLPLAIMGITREEIIGKCFWDIPAWRDLPDMQASLKERIKHAAQIDEPILTEDRYRTATGEVREAAAALTAIRDENGAVQYFIIQASDIHDKKIAEQELLQNQQQLKNAHRIAQLGSWQLEVPKNKLIWSDEVYEIFGVEKGQFGETFEDFLAFVPPEDQSEILAVRTSTLRGEVINDVEHRIIRPDGSIRYVQQRGELLLDPQGNPHILSGTVQDITEKKRAEEQTQRLADRLAATLESMTDAFFVVDRDWRLVYLNEQTEILAGNSRAAMLGTTIEDMFPEPLGRQILETCRLTFKQSTPQSSETPFTPPDCCFEIRSFPSDEGIAVYLHDITNRKTSENALHAVSAQLLAILDYSPFLITELDLDGRYLLINKAACQVLNREEQDILGKNYRDILAESTRQHFESRMAKVLDTGAPLVVEDRFGEGEFERIYSTVIFPLSNENGRITSIGGIAQDVTDRVKAEEERERLAEQLRQSQKMEAVGRLAGGVAHDFNNMLSVILGHAELALANVDEKNIMHEDITAIVTAGKRSAELTNQLLAFARKQTIAPKVLDLNATIEGLIKMLKRLITEEISLKWKPGNDLGPLKLDPAQIDQLLVNLTLNARDAIESTGEIIIETHAVKFDEAERNEAQGITSDEYVVLSVTDTGCGMDEATRNQIFEPFFTTKAQGEGTGLGMATVYGIVSQNKGFINVYSEVGMGTSIKIYLPRHHEELVQHQPATTPTAETITYSETILLVEDEEALLKLATRLLERMGYTVLPINDPTKATAFVETYEGNIDLLITDVIMPGLSGREVWAQLRALRPGLKCIFMSGYTADVIAQHGVLEEGIQFLQKPFNSASLSEKVRQTLDT